METEWFLALLTFSVLLWFIFPFLIWRRYFGQALEGYIARTSFRAGPGALVPPVWKAPEVSLSVVVPAYNEELRLPPMLDETLDYLESRGAASSGAFSYEVLVVDDGSSDRTFAAAVSSRQRRPELRYGELRVMQLTENCGKGFAVRAGMLASRGTLLLLADADGATSIRDCERLELALDDEACVAYGSRHHLAWETQSLSSLALHGWLRSVVGCGVHDAQCGFKLFKASVGRRLFASLHLCSWSFDLEVLLLCRLLGVKVAEVPVTWVPMPGSKKNPFWGPITIVRDVFLTQLLYFFGVWHPSVLA